MKQKRLIPMKSNFLRYITFIILIPSLSGGILGACGVNLLKDPLIFSIIMLPIIIFCNLTYHQLNWFFNCFPIIYEKKVNIIFQENNIIRLW